MESFLLSITLCVVIFFYIPRYVIIVLYLPHPARNYVRALPLCSPLSIQAHETWMMLVEAMNGGAPVSHQFQVRDIPNAGRGVIATAPIPAGTAVLESGPPAFHVLFKTYSKETCAYCFLWDRGRTLPVRDSDVGKVFCSEACQERWREEHGAVGLEAWRCLTLFVRAKGRGAREDEIMGDGARPVPEEIEGAWKEAEKQARILQAHRADARTTSKAERKLLQGIMRKMSESVDSDMLSYFLCGILSHRSRPALWKEEVLALAMDPQPYKTRKDLEVACTSYLQLSTIIPPSSPLAEEDGLIISPGICRTMLQADNHNAFGIRGGGEDSEEYMGYGVYPCASYFNHSCAPNIGKRREGRSWVFSALREIAPDEECCITYLGGDEKGLDVLERRKRLEGAWGFPCACERCRSESGS